MTIGKSKILIFDIESDGLWDTVSKIHEIVIYDPLKNAFLHFPKERVQEGVLYLEQADYIAGHNVLDYDVPVIQKFYPKFKPPQVVDTLVWSRLAFPDMYNFDMSHPYRYRVPKGLKGRHSLKSWGYRLGELKGDFGETTDWKEWSPEMSRYCEQDVRVNKLLYEFLSKQSISKDVLKLEHDVQRIISRQIRNGFWFDKDAAECLYGKLIARRQELEGQLKEVFPTIVVPASKVKISKVNNKRYGYVKGCKYQKIEYQEFNPASRDQIVLRLQRKYGWKPSVLTDGGKPKMDEEILETLDYPEAKFLLEYLMVNKRIGQIAEGDQAWLKSYNSDTHRIHGYVNTLGTVTRRATHSSPNMSQVPAIYSPYGKECRALWQPRPGWVQVGGDASGLELRCLAHYLAQYDNGKYAHTILEDDIHTANQHAAGLETRDQAKRFIYAFCYGAGGQTLGEIVGGGSKEGNKIRRQFLQKIEGMKQLKEAVERASKRGYLKTLDGYRVLVDQPYKALNRLLQSVGAIIMKKAMVILDDDLRDKGLSFGQDYEFMMWAHDEFQLEVADEDKAKLVGEAIVEAIKRAGEFYDFRCPLDGEYKIGHSWADCH